jgi:hypothetical protein
MRVLRAGSLLLALGVAGAQDFVREIRPIFEKSCYQCHGEKSALGGLRLDSKALASKVIQPGKAADSTLYRRIAGIGDQPRMPMGGKPLDAAQLALIASWIDRGAQWPETAASSSGAKPHWAFVPPRRPEPPPARRAAWSKNPIDRFVLARLDSEGLAPSPEADPVTLLRRLSLDLIGLPPSIQEVDAFLKDKSPDAWEKQVDRLLASPHYGERWGRLWLDAARYADSDGYEKDKPRQVWFYRDWVIRALNRDLPYDRFLTEQLAGDMLPDATQDQRIATGFLRNSMINEEGGVDPEQFRMEAMFDRMDAIGKSMLGVTIQCAQCHNHKFDPLTQEEYYRIFAFLNDSHESNIAVYTPEEQVKRAEMFRRIGEIETGLQHRNPDWRERLAAWEDKVRTGQPEWTVVKLEVDDISTGGQRYLPLADGSLLAQGYAPTKHRVKLVARTDAPRVTAFRLELLNDPNLPLGGPGRSIRGTGALTEFEVEAAPADAPGKNVKIKIARATADIALPETVLDSIYADKSGKRRVTGPVAFAIDGNDDTAWGIETGPALRNQPRKAVFEAETPVSDPSGTILTFYLKQNHGGWNSDDNQNNNLGRIRLSVTGAAGAQADPLPARAREILALPREKRTEADVRALFSYWRTTVPEWSAENDAIEALWKTHPAGSSQLVLAARGEMRGTHILTRGDFLKPAKEVAPGVPAFLNPLPAGAPTNRLTFARWMTDRAAPTTARAMMNRVWQAYFGAGLVTTSEDLGRQCEPPSHPELLDWLAVEFMDRGWSLKAMHRLVAASAVYRQSSHVTPALYARDPYNRLLARGPRFRVDAEIVRDIALAASGLLNPKIGGPSVYPPAPEFLFQPPVSYGPKVWEESKGADRYRRALYTFRYRSVPFPALQNFDAPNGDIACVRRSRSNTPLQALTTLNEPLFVESARSLAALALKEGGASDADKLTYAFRRSVARRPSGPERAELLAFLEKRKTEMPEPEAWTAVARVLLNLDETITKE